MDVDDVLAPKRQREIQNLADALAQWNPSRIAVENVAEPPALLLSDYADAENLLRTSRNESVQLGFRLAAMMGHHEVYGFDEQSSEGEPNYFPLGAVQQFAEANEQMHILRVCNSHCARINAG